MAQMTVTEVLLYNTCADPERAARVHASTCEMLKTAGRKVVRVEGPDLQETIDDLNERGYPVKRCKCLKEK